MKGTAADRAKVAAILRRWGGTEAPDGVIAATALGRAIVAALVDERERALAQPRAVIRNDVEEDW